MANRTATLTRRSTALLTFGLTMILVQVTEYVAYAAPLHYLIYPWMHAIMLMVGILVTGIVLAFRFVRPGYVHQPRNRNRARPRRTDDDAPEPAIEPTPLSPSSAQIYIVNSPPQPARVPAPAPVPLPPVTAADFDDVNDDPRNPSIFDQNPISFPSPSHTRHADRTLAFDPLTQPGAPLAPDPNGLSWGSPSPWDNEPVPTNQPLHSGPLLPRRPPKAGEITLIREIYEETGSLNATIRRVYGSKDAKTHAWTKEALLL